MFIDCFFVNSYRLIRLLFSVIRLREWSCWLKRSLSWGILVSIFMLRWTSRLEIKCSMPLEGGRVDVWFLVICLLEVSIYSLWMWCSISISLRILKPICIELVDLGDLDTLGWLSILLQMMIKKILWKLSRNWILKCFPCLKKLIRVCIDFDGAQAKFWLFFSLFCEFFEA